ncbi:DUF928 domain-containing protein [Planktothrix sp. FACHB-1375]|uniref:DUF928 domain-containing protein n=2 Tax=Oscillatoriophycideae TaxID=1301283 RepID=A0A926VK34_9CYAN|nr:DUF928 domain-containing protein [Aerosakkonema funiforme FACHB-1375]
MVLKCNFQDEFKDNKVGGYTQRIEPSADLLAKLEKAKTIRDRINIYAKAGIWQDTVTNLALYLTQKRNNLPFLICPCVVSIIRRTNFSIRPISQYFC